MPESPRNVIILHCDEMRADCAGFAGSRDARTPHLDALAATGVTLDRHFTVHGKCVPSRVAMVTGRYAHTDGARTVMEPDLVPPDRPDLLKVLRARGYETAVIGHNHCWPDLPHLVEHHSHEGGAYADLNRERWQAPPAPPGGRTCPALPDGCDYHGRYTGELGGWGDDTFARQALRFLTTGRDRSRPFYLQLNFLRPHPPYFVEEPFYGMFDPQAITPFPLALPRHASLPFRAQRRHRTGEGPFPETWAREILATYLGMIAKVDHLMGQVLDVIGAQGLFDNSVVVFTSDHGDFASQYGLCEKFDTVMSDCLLRVPCILRAPGLAAGTRCNALTSHIDLPATILELLQQPPEPEWNMHGRSLVPVLTGGERPDAVFADGGHEVAMRTRFNAKLWKPDRFTGAEVKAVAGKQHTYHGDRDSMARTSMVRTETHKLVMRENGDHELYDLIADPWELDNRHGDPALANVQSALCERLVRWHLQTLSDRPYHPVVGA